MRTFAFPFLLKPVASNVTNFANSSEFSFLTAVNPVTFTFFSEGIVTNFSRFFVFANVKVTSSSFDKFSILLGVILTSAIAAFNSDSVLASALGFSTKKAVINSSVLN